MANSLLYPQNTKTRRKLRLDGLWKFKFDPESRGDKENWHKGLTDSDWMPVPSSFNDLSTSKAVRDYSGILWYERDLYIPREWDGKDLDLRFGSVTHQATVFVNGQKVGEHLGGYTPFNVSIQENVFFDEKNTLVVRVSNELYETTLPAGTTQKNLLGKPIASTPTDFFNYSGIQRSVDLVATPKESIQDISFTFDIDSKEKRAKVHYTVEALGEGDFIFELYDKQKNRVGQAKGQTGTVEIEHASLWQPLNAYLYTYKITLENEEEILDVYGDRLGIRTVEVKDEQLLINNQEVYLKGYSKPEQFELHGAGKNIATIKRDFELMKWNGANAFRTFQYPHDEEVYRLADEEGFIVINELPAYGLELPKPNRFQPDLAKGLEPFFERENVQKHTKAHHLNVLNELIARDKNYASVCVWSVMNEPDTGSEAFTPYAEEIIQQAKELDVQNRPVTILFKASSLDEKPELTDLVDIVAVNEYYGWDGEDQGGYELSDALYDLSEKLNDWTAHNKPVFITGYGAEAFQGEMKLPSVQWSEDYQGEVLKAQHELFDEHKAIRGEFVWSFSDYQTPEGLTAIDGNSSGVFTDDRQPKTSAYVLKTRWEN